MKEQEAKGLLSSLGLQTPLSKIPLLGKMFVLILFDIKWINFVSGG